MATKTVRLTRTEWVGLIKILLEELGTANILIILAKALGLNRATNLVAAQSGSALSKKDNHALVRELYPYIPGKNRREKVRWLVKNARTVFKTEKRFNEVLDYVLAKVQEFAEAGGTLQSYPSTPAVLPEIGQGTISGYGRVNKWWENPDILDRETTIMAESGVRCYLIELIGNGEEDVLGNPAKLERVKAAYIELLRCCRAKGIWVLVSGVNDNIGNGRYKNGRVNLSSRLPQARELFAFVKAQGPENVLFQPTAETQTSAGRSLEIYVASTMQEFRLVNNGSVGRPASVASWAQYRAYHMVNTGAWPTNVSHTFAVSDTGAILAQLYIGGNYYGQQNPDAIRSWINDGAARGLWLVGHYAFQVEGIDEDAIRACGLTAHSETNVYAAGATHLGDDVDLSNAVWIGRVNASKAQVTEDIAPMTHDSKKFYYQQSAGTKDWKPRFRDNGKDLNSYACLVIWRNGKWTGGRFDDCSETRNWREKKNIVNGYLGGLRPAAGEPFRLFLVNADATERTKAPGGIWK